MNEIISCKICRNKLRGKQTMYCGISCKNKAHQSYSAQKHRGLKRKMEIVESLGGKCSSCGYNKNLSALVFHHQDPKRKSFKLDTRSLSNRKFSQITNELKKCTLLCHNCHSEIHNPQHDLASLSSSRLL